MDAANVNFILRECDAVAIITTKDLLETLVSVIPTCSTIKFIIHLPELYSFVDINNEVVPENIFIKCNDKIECKFIPFSDLLSMCLKNCKFLIFFHLKQITFFFNKNK